MALAAGARLGPYEILSPLGAGGMGEVWRARDTRLGRRVAIKILPAEFSSDPGRLRRFEQEARAASALNHPNIITVHDVGQVDSGPYIAMELVEGRSVRDLMASGPVAVRKLLDVAAQCAEGLAKAHDAGIVHRDLKPENVMVTNDGRVKILDFGLAKLTHPEQDGGQPVEERTVSELTRPGVVMGTATYMSPEQASGHPVDFRSDQFSLGSILYEMATGKRAFQRPTSVDTLAAILHDEPEPIAALAPKSPAPLRWIVDRCLAKDPNERYASTVDLARDLGSVRQHISELSGREAALPSGRRWSRERAGWAVAAAALLVGLAAGFLARRHGEAAPETRPSIRLNLTFPAAETPLPFLRLPGSTLAFSPDGTRLVYVGSGPEGRLLYVWPLDRFAAAPIPDTSGAMGPFFSPDGRWIGFNADGKLKKVSIDGGQPLTLCDAPALRGASWGPDGNILFTPSGAAGLWRVSDKGGEAKPLTTIDKAKGEGTHRWPDILPGGKAAIFTVHGLSGSYDKARIDVVLLETGERRTLLEGATDARYLPTGHLVYLRGNSLYAVPFDVKRLAVRGSAVPVLDGVASVPIIGLGNYAFTPAGHLVYFANDPRWFERELVWLDRKGNARPLAEAKRAYSQVRFSPDGRRLAAVVGEPDSDIWIYDLARNSWDRLTPGGVNQKPVWAPDGQNMAFASNRSGPINPFFMPIDRSRPAEQLVKSEAWIFPDSLSPDGRTLLLLTQTPETGLDISVVALDGDRKVRPFIQTPSDEGNARFSPDGRFVAYESDASGRHEVFVTAFPGPRGRWQVSTEGGQDPVWSRDGRELFYSSGPKLMAVAIETHPQFSAGVPRLLFERQDLEAYDVAPDGKSFVGIRQIAREPGSVPLAVILNWFDDVKRRMAAWKKSP